MKHVSYALLLAGAIMTHPLPGAGQLVINEIMQSNVDALFVDNEFPDSWVELYNAGGEPVSLGGYKIGPSGKESKAYKIEDNTVVPANGYCVIYCDKTGEGLHASFRLESTKAGAVYLFDVSGKVVDSLEYPAMAAPNIAYGKSGAGEWGPLVKATPGAENLSAVASEFAGSPVFSVAGGLFDAPVRVTVSKPDGAAADSRLCITVDGREPEESDAVEGDSKTLDISVSTSVRARIVSPTLLPEVSVTNSYIFHPRVTELPVVSITMNPEYLYDEEIGIFMGELDKNPNWEHDWRRPMNVEYFDGDGHRQLINQLGETRVKGGWSRRYSQKSMVFYANKRFGEKRYDSSSFWPDKPEIKKVKSFELRNSGTDFEGAHVRDALAQRLVGLNSPNVDWQAYRLVVCYINGEYRGIYDLRERTNEDYIEANYDGLEDIDMVENWWEVKAGTGDALWKFTELYNRADVTFEELSAVMDVDNFLDMFAIETFAGNTDYPHNNIVCWKPWADGGKWRWVLKDIDRFAITWEQGQHRHDYFRFIADMASPASDEWTRRNIRLFALFMEMPEARDLFIDRLAIFMGDFLQPDYIDGMLDEMSGEIRPEFYDHCRLYFPNDYHWRVNGGWQNEIDFISEWCKKRRTFLYDRIRTYFGLSSSYDLIIKTNGRTAMLNGVKLTQPEFHGCYYNNRKLSLATEEGYNWKVTVTRGNGATTTEYTPELGGTLLLADAKSVVAESVVCDPALLALPEATDMTVVADGLTVKVMSGVGDFAGATVYSADGIAVGRIASPCRELTVGVPGIYVVHYTTYGGGSGSAKVACVDKNW